MKEPEELLNGYFDGSLTVDESSELRAWLASDREHMRMFVRESVIHSRLHDILHETEMSGVVYDEALGDTIDPRHIASLLDEEEASAQRRRREMGEPTPEVTAFPFIREERLESKSPSHKGPRLANALIYSGLAVAAALVVMAFRQVPPTPVPLDRPLASAPAVEKLPPIAEISNELVATMIASERRVAAGERLSPGPLTVASGVAEILFTSGVKMVVEGPAELMLLSADRARLDRGRVVINVPKQAIGFTLVSEAAAFVDLGTEFGVEVDATGAASIHVLEGQVALVSEKKGTAPSRMLIRGVASQVNAAGSVADIPFDEARFLRRVPSSAYELAVLKSQPLAYWWLDEMQRPGTIVGGGKLPLAGRMKEGVELKKFDPSAFSGLGPLQAALFTGEHNGIEIAPRKELGLVNNLTCEAWVLPDEASTGRHRIFSTFDRPHSGMALGVVDGGRFELSEGEMRVHFTAYGGYDCISTTPLAPGQWVHLVATVDRDGTPTLYVDGKVVAHKFRIAPATIDFETFEDKPAIWSDERPDEVGQRSGGEARIGRNPLGSDGKITPERWQGQIGNVALYDRVLNAREISEHYQATRDRAVDRTRSQQ